MSDKKKLTYNIIFSLLYSSVNILFPFLTVSYASHILNVEQMGKVDYGVSIMNWFVMVAAFGTNFYGVREIAKCNSTTDIRKRSQVFSEIFLLNCSMSFFCILVYLAVFSMLGIDSHLKWILLLYICFNPFIMDWFFQGVEQYRYIAIRNFIARILTFILLILIVKEDSDYIIYAWVGVFTLFLNGTINFNCVRKLVKIDFRKARIRTIPMHWKNCNLLFISSFFATLIGSTDTIMAGRLFGSVYSAYARRCSLIIQAGTMIPSAIVNASLPRIVQCSQEGAEKLNQKVNELFPMLLIVSVPIVCIYIVCAAPILWIVGGKQYVDAEILLQCYVPAALFSPLNFFLNTNLINVMKKEKEGLLINVGCYGTYLLLNWLLCQFFGISGIGLGKSASEFLSFFIRILFLEKMGIRIRYRQITPYFGAGIVMMLVLFLIKGTGIIWLIFRCVLACLSYLLVLRILKESIIMDIRKFVREMRSNKNV